ncbi:MAG: hypothetical protein AB8F78_20140 [Saprospiraceae bacterium]
MTIKDYLKRGEAKDILSTTSIIVLNHLIDHEVEELEYFAAVLVRSSYASVFKELNGTAPLSMTLVCGLLHFGIDEKHLLRSDVGSTIEKTQKEGNSARFTPEWYAIPENKELISAWKSINYSKRASYKRYEPASRYSDAKQEYKSLTDQIVKVEKSIFANHLLSTRNEAGQAEEKDCLQQVMYNAIEARLEVSKGTIEYKRSFSISPLIPWWTRYLSDTETKFLVLASLATIKHVWQCMNQFPDSCVFNVYDDSLLRNHLILDNKILATEDYAFSKAKSALLPSSLFVDYSVSSRLKDYRDNVIELMSANPRIAKTLTKGLFQKFLSIAEDDLEIMHDDFQHIYGLLVDSKRSRRRMKLEEDIKEIERYQNHIKGVKAVFSH